MTDTTIYDDQYTGPRWRYASTIRPWDAFFFPQTVQDIRIMLSNGTHPDYPHGTLDFTEQLPVELISQWSLATVEHIPAPVVTDEEEAAEWAAEADALRQEVEDLRDQLKAAKDELDEANDKLLELEDAGQAQEQLDELKESIENIIQDLQYLV